MVVNLSNLDLSLLFMVLAILLLHHILPNKMALLNAIIDTGMALLHHASAPSTYWTYALATTVYLINRLLTILHSRQSLFEVLFGRVSDYKKLRTFGYQCYPWLVPYRANKFQSKSQPCVFLGYSLTQHAFQCLNIHTGKIYLSRHVTFDESIFPFKLAPPSVDPPSATQCQTSSPPSPVPPVCMVPLETPITIPLVHDGAATVPPSPTPGMPSSSPLNNSSSSVSPLPAAPALPGRTHPMVTRAQNNIFYPKQLSVTTKHPLDPPLEPTCVSQALKDPKWCKAMATEFTALVSHDTWRLVPRPSSTNLIGCKWVFMIKRHPDGTVDRFKARLVAKRFNQRPGVDYTETFSPVIKPTTIHLILSVALSHNWSLKQLDVNNAFLHGQLNKQVFMHQLAGFIDQSHPHHVCSLQKSIYGLK
jgi:histone deacetylase 1/2